MWHTNKNAKLVSKTSAFQLHQQEISSFQIQVLAQKQRCLLFLERGSSDWQRFLHPHSPRTYLCCTGRCHHCLTWGYKRQDGGRGCTRKALVGDWNCKSPSGAQDIFFKRFPAAPLTLAHTRRTARSTTGSTRGMVTVQSGRGKLQREDWDWDKRRRQSPAGPAGCSLLRDCNQNTEKDCLGLLCFY